MPEALPPKPEEVQVDIEGGEVFDQRGQEKPKAGKAKDADRIKVTRYLLWTLIGTIVAHIATTAFFSATNNAEAVKAMAAVFNVWVPVLSSLVGAAVAWYFTKET